MTEQVIDFKAKAKQKLDAARLAKGLHLQNAGRVMAHSLLTSTFSSSKTTEQMIDQSFVLRSMVMNLLAQDALNRKDQKIQKTHEFINDLVADLHNEIRILAQCGEKNIVKLGPKVEEGETDERAPTEPAS